MCSQVRAFALKTCVEVAKKAGAWLTPHVASMAEAMLTNLSLMEPAALNYYAFHVRDKSQLEAARASAANSGPGAEVLDLCVRHADEAAVLALAPRLCSMARAAVGLPSRAGLARFVAQLCRCASYHAHEDDFMRTCAWPFDMRTAAAAPTRTSCGRTAPSWPRASPRPCAASPPSRCSAPSPRAWPVQPFQEYP